MAEKWKNTFSYMDDFLNVLSDDKALDIFKIIALLR
jgi:hypothetical protein